MEVHSEPHPQRSQDTREQVSLHPVAVDHVGPRAHDRGAETAAEVCAFWRGSAHAQQRCEPASLAAALAELGESARWLDDLRRCPEALRFAQERALGQRDQADFHSSIAVTESSNAVE
jgi:hypothetical protein